MFKALIIDDDQGFVEIFKQRLQAAGLQVESLDDEKKCLEKIATGKPHVIFLDLNFGSGRETAGIDVLRQIRGQWKEADLPVVMLSGTGTAEILRQTRRLGAEKYLSKPIDDFEEVVHLIHHLAGRANNLTAQRMIDEPLLIGHSRVFMEAVQKLIDAAEQGVNVLLLGETGVGKGLFAEAYRQHCNRPREKYVRVFCGGLTNELIVSEIFGHVKGSFTSAMADKPGLIEAAEGGVVFMDEIGELSPEAQSKLLDLWDRGEFKRLGEHKTRKLNAIILTATNRDLEAMVDVGTFSDALYYRMQDCMIRIPPLREHLDDMEMLCRHFLAINDQNRMLEIDPKVIAAMKQFEWRGNIRQLEKCLQSAKRACRGQKISLRDVEPYLPKVRIRTTEELQAFSNFSPQGKNYRDFKDYLDEVELELQRRFYTFHLDENNWNVSKTARTLNMTREFLAQIISKLNLQKMK